MNRFEPSTPGTRTTLAVAAVAMTMLSLSLFLVAPAQLENRLAEAPPAPAIVAPWPGATEVAIIPTRIDVVGSKDSKRSWRQVLGVFPAFRQPS